MFLYLSLSKKPNISPWPATIKSGQAIPSKGRIMGQSGLGSVVGHLRGLAAPVAGDLTDGQLLTAYCSESDQGAFAALVKRHGGIVQAVCARVLRRPEDREDAFQATFLVLARDAALVRKRESIAGWLHGVARHVALNARRAAARRHKYEERAMTMPATNPAWEAAWREVQVVLDEEIQRLPGKYRDVFVLSCLESQSCAEVAGRLGLKEGTVRSRLNEARQRLKQRLGRRGVELHAVLGTAALASPSHVPAAVTAHLASTAGQLATGQRLGSGLISARILSLVHGVPRAMFLTKAKLITLFLLVFGALVGGVGALASQRGTPVETRQLGPGSPRAVGNPAPVAGKGEQAVWKKLSDLDLVGSLPVAVAYSPDGRRLAVGGTQGIVFAFDRTKGKKEWETGVTGNFAALAYSADGKSILATFPDGVRFLDAASGKPGESLEEKGIDPVAVGVFPDRDFFAGQNQKFTSHKIIFGGAHGYVVKIWVGSGAPGTIHLNTGNPKDSADLKAVPLAVDPEGRCVICKTPVVRESGKNALSAVEEFAAERKVNAVGKNALWAYVAGDNDPGSPGNRSLKGHEASVVSAAWSKDGKRAATGDAAGRVILWDGKTMKEVQRLELGGRVAALALSPDADQLAAVVIGEHAEFRVGQPGNWQKNKRLLVDSSDFSGPVYAALAFSPDGRQLAGSAINMEWLTRLGILVGHVHRWDKAVKSQETQP
jgi:RNA polymerase sigma factor (sigma-70 family)